MNWWRELSYVIRRLKRRRAEQDLDEEIQTHLELEIEERIAEGVPPEEARYAALRAFGNVALAKEESRATWGFGSLETLARDLRYGTRMLLRNPAFTVVTVITLALGIGVNSAIFTIVNAYLFRPMPVKDPQRLVVIATKDQRVEVPHEVSYPNYEDLRDYSGVFTDAIAFDTSPVNISTEGQAERAWVGLVSGNYFSMLGVEAARGRTFTTEEGQINRPAPVAVLAYDFWQSRFGSDPSVIGKTVRLNNHPLTVVGVAPAVFHGTDPWVAVDLYVPVGMKELLFPGSAGSLKQRDDPEFRVLARLKSGVSLEQVRAAVDVLARQLQQEYPAANKGVTFATELETKSRPDISLSDPFHRTVVIVMALVGLVLLIACANVANLMLTRATTRQKEIALRAALGASRMRLIRQLLTESVVIALLGGSVGLLLALWTTDWLSAYKVATDTPVKFDLHPDWHVFAFTLLAAVLTGMLTGLAPALQSSRHNLVEALKEGGRASGGTSGRQRLRSLLVVSQVAVSLLLLICSGLFVRSLKNAESMDLGFRTDNLLMLSTNVGLQGYDEARGRQFYQQLIDRVRALPGVAAASLARDVPFGYSNDSEDVTIEGRAPATKEETPSAFCNVIGPDYLRTMGITLIEGRDFTEHDNGSAPRVVIVNEAFARRFWPGQDPLGKRFKLSSEDPYLQVVGVTKTGKWLFIGEEPRPFFYLPLAQNYCPRITLHLYAAADAAGLSAAVRQVVRELDKDLPVYDVRTMQAHLFAGRALLFVRLGAMMVGIFGLLGLLLAVVGIYGVISYSVTQRTHEIGIRMALGAQKRDVLKLIVGQGMILTLIGVGIGLVGAFALTRALSGLLYGVSATDPATFTLVALLLIAVALLASYLPARGATKVDPMIALRYE